MIEALTQALTIMRKDKWVLLFSSFPVVIGLLLYFFIGKWLYSDVYTWGKELMVSSIESGWASALSVILIALLTVVFYFFINWTFVIVVSLLACPFNDFISSRVEDFLSKKQKEGSVSLGRMFSNFLKILFNELKKIILIILISLLGLAMSFVLPPVSLIISVILIAISFVDYSWARDERSLKGCFSDLKRGVFSYTLMGAFFLFLVGIPVINLFAIPYGVVVFTILYVNNQKTRETFLGS